MVMFTGKVAFVTGGSSGIGQATALEFAKHGAKVAIADVNTEGGEDTVARLNALGSEAVFVRTDVSQATEVARSLATVIATYGGLDFAFNNAGVIRRGGIVGCAEEDWDRLMQVNLKGMWLCMKYEIPHMLTRGGGVIVNMASVYGLVGAEGLPAYTASKHGVVGLTKSAALEYAHRGIRINAVCPGVTRTPMAQLDAKKEALWNARHPIGRVAEPHDIATAVVWLCSDAAAFITGHALPVDGGYVSA
jgi:NAD(P)-dependent dehydrogenase (short-subunit alcohol dehydrogenase family)